MKKNANCFICFILLFLAACSTEPIETGPFRTHTYKCALDGHEYDRYDYDLFCNEEHADFTRVSDSILRIIITEPIIKKNCNIDNVRLESEYRCETEWLNVRILFDSIKYHLRRKYSYNEGFYVEVNHGEKEYNCPDLLPAGVDSVFTASTCSDTLGIQAIIDVFANFPDSLCEELPKD